MNTTIHIYLFILILFMSVVILIVSIGAHRKMISNLIKLKDIQNKWNREQQDHNKNIVKLININKQIHLKNKD